MQKNLSNLRIRNDILREKSAFFNYRDVVCLFVFKRQKAILPVIQLIFSIHLQCSKLQDSS